jgi:ergothioneine biosynthesis protein EgtB
MSPVFEHRVNVSQNAGLIARYREIRDLTVHLTDPLTAEDQMVQSAVETSPTKWHLAHTSWFFETFVLQPHAHGYRCFNERFSYLFNSYYKQLDGHPLRALRGTFSRPSLAEIEDYRGHVDDAMERFLAGPWHGQLDVIELGLQHEQQHQELIVTDIKHAFWSNPIRPAYRPFDCDNASAPLPLKWVEFPGGKYEIGSSGTGFAFDNEMPRHGVLVPAFRLASRLVTNAEYLEFMMDRGYERPELWLSDGWDHVSASGWHAPLYWEEAEGSWRTFTGGGTQPLALNEPVCHVSYYEADAFARWRGARLSSEAEWETAAGTVPVEGNFLEERCPHPRTATGSGSLQQVFGDAWEWTASPYVAYPGYRQAAGVLGEYNGKFMCNQLVLRGGSCATPKRHIRASYRNFFPPHARWQFMGVRLANDCR